MSEIKVGRGRPVGKKVNWSGVFWNSMTNSQIAEKVGTSVPNVFTRRKRLIAEGKKAAYKGAKYTHYKSKQGQKKQGATQGVAA